MLVAATIICDGIYFAGVVGHSGGFSKCEVKNSQFLGTLKKADSSSSAAFIGGMIGWGNSQEYSISNCKFGGRYIGDTDSFSTVGFCNTYPKKTPQININNNDITRNAIYKDKYKYANNSWPLSCHDVDYNKKAALEPVFDEKSITYKEYDSEIRYTGSPYSGEYDGNEHGIAVDVSEPKSNIPVLYGENKYEYLTTVSPLMKDAGTKEVYYQICAEDYPTVFENESITITKATNSASIAIESWKYGDKANKPEVTAKFGKDSAVIEYKEKDADDSTYSQDVPNKAGRYTVRASIAETGNYFGAVATADFIIKEKEGTDDQSGDRINQMGEDGTALGRGASFEAAERAILGMTSDSDPAGSKINPLKLRSKKQTKNSIKLTWTGAGGATKYVIYGNKCNSKGVRYEMTKLAETSKKTYNVKKIAGKKLGKGKYHKFIVVAVDGNNNVISTSKVIHVATKGEKAGNYIRVSVSKNAVKKAKKLKAGKTLKLKGKAVGKRVKKHVKVRYESTNPNVATVTSGGKVKAVSKGKANITVYAHNGVYKNVKVVVK